MEIGCSEVPKPLLTPPYFDQLSERHQLLSNLASCQVLQLVTFCESTLMSRAD